MTKKEKEIIRNVRDVFKDTRKVLADAGAPLELSLPAMVAADVLDWVLGEFPEFENLIALTALKNQELCKLLLTEPSEELQILPGWASPPVLDKLTSSRRLPRRIDPRIVSDESFLRACGIQPNALNK